MFPFHFIKAQNEQKASTSKLNEHFTYIQTSIFANDWYTLIYNPYAMCACTCMHLIFDFLESNQNQCKQMIIIIRPIFRWEREKNTLQIHCIDWSFKVIRFGFLFSMSQIWYCEIFRLLLPEPEIRSPHKYIIIVFVFESLLLLANWMEISRQWLAWQIGIILYCSCDCTLREPSAFYYWRWCCLITFIRIVFSQLYSQW